MVRSRLGVTVHPVGKRTVYSFQAELSKRSSTGAGMAVGVGIAVGAGLGIAVGAGVAVGAGLGVGARVGTDVGVDVGIDVGVGCGVDVATCITLRGMSAPLSGHGLITVKLSKISVISWNCSKGDSTQSVYPMIVVTGPPAELWDS